MSSNNLKSKKPKGYQKFKSVVIEAIEDTAKNKSELALLKKITRSYDPTSGPRCVKFAPKLMPKHSVMTSATLAASQLHWRRTMDAMGGLYRASLADPNAITRSKRGVPGTYMTPAPYHCNALGRIFDAQYGRANKVQLCGETNLKEKSQDHKNTCTNIKVTALPKIKPLLSRLPIDCVEEVKGFPKSGKLLDSNLTFELPVTCLKIQWGASPGRAYHSSEDICEWLAQFGAVMFTLPFSERSMLAAFDTVRSAMACINAPNCPRELHVTWSHANMYNFGEIKINWDYRLSKDPKWQPLLKMIEREKESKKAADIMRKHSKSS